MRHNEVHRAFDLTVWGYFLDFALVPVAVVALCIFAGWRVLPSYGVALAMLAGVLIWSLAEYWIHRAIFHGDTPFETMHQQHHALPKDMIGLASWATFAGFSGLWLIAQTFAGAAVGSAVTAGVMAGYLGHCAIHVSIHHAAARGFGRYGAMMLALHRAHHRGGKGNFGVTSPIWDFVFGTYQPPRDGIAHSSHHRRPPMKLSLRFALLAAILALFIAYHLLGPIVALVVVVALMTYAYVPINRARWIPAAGFVVIVLAPGFAFAATIDVGQAFSGGIVEAVNGMIAGLITALVGWVLMTVKAKFNIDIEAKHREALTAFLQRQASSLVARGAVKVQGLKVEVASDAVAVAANTALAAIPDALKFFGLTPAALEKRIIDLLPQQPAIAQAQAVALDVANPLTPSGSPAAVK